MSVAVLTRKFATVIDPRYSNHMRTAVALGSNLGDRLANLRAARKAIVDLPGVGPPVLRLRFMKLIQSAVNQGLENF